MTKHHMVMALRWHRKMWMAQTIQNVLIFSNCVTNFKGIWLLNLKFYIEKKGERAVLYSRGSLFLMCSWGLLDLLCMLSSELWLKELKNISRTGTIFVRDNWEVFMGLLTFYWWLDHVCVWETIVWTVSKCSCICYKIWQMQIQS